MRKIVSGIFAGALCAALLTWAYDAMGGGGPAGGSHDDAAPAGAEHPALHVSDGVDNADAKMDRAQTRRFRRMAEKMELTDAQRQQIKTLRSAYARDMVRLRADAKLARIELRELMNETGPEVSRVRERAAEVSRARASLFERRTVFRAEFKNLLTPEQQETLRESFRDRRDGRRDSGMRGRRGVREFHERH